MNNTIIKTFYEYIPVNASKILGKDFSLDDFDDFLIENNLEKVFNLSRKQIIPQNYVGVLSYNNYQFEILPKLLKIAEEKDSDNSSIINNLIFMLLYVRDIPTEDLNIVSLAKDKNPFLEILIQLYANSLFEAIKKFIPRNYVNISGNLNFLKGKILFNKHIKHNLFNKAHFYCEYDEFCENTLLNQTFKYVTKSLIKLSQNEDNKKKLKLILNVYEDVSLVNITQEHTKRVYLNYTQRIYETPLKLAKLFIENASIKLQSGNLKINSILFDMNLLFEEFIFEFINKNKNSLGVKDIYSQKGKSLIKESQKYQPLTNTWQLANNSSKVTRSDILLEFKNNNKIIIDTKYKQLNDYQTDFKTADFYQVFVYKQLHRKHYEEEVTFPEVILLYPQVLNCEPFLWRYIINSEKDDSIYVCSVNLHIDLKKTPNLLLDEINNILKQIRYESFILKNYQGF